LPEISMSGPDACFSALYPQGAPAQLRSIRIAQGDVPGDLAQAFRQGASLHLVLEPGAGLKRAWRLALLTRQLARHGYACRLVGLGGPVERPRMVVPLRRNLLGYVDTVAFRGTDSPARVWFKRLTGLLPPSLTWRGPLLLVASPTAETFDRFVLLTGDRQIAFLFRRNEPAPWAVCKTGARADLVAEQRNHNRAVAILGPRVPGVLGLTEGEGTASLSLECLPERFLGNVVAAALWGRRKVFVREALGHLDFCREVYRLLAEKGGMEQVVVSAGDVNGMLDGLEILLGDSGESTLLKRMLTQIIGTTLPRMIQHGDFCVRNILITGGGRGRVLIDWEDLQERRWPLADFALLWLSLKEVYASLFAADLAAMERLPALADGLAALEVELMKILNLDSTAMRAAQVLSLACLCRQNLGKGRLDTATAIFGELMTCVRENLETPAARAAS